MNTAIRREEYLAVREVDGEILVLDTLSNQIHQLNRTASFIWRMCEARAAPAAIVAAFAAEYAVDADTAQEDVMETLCRLRSLNLLANC